MADKTYFEAGDAVAGYAADIYVTIDGKRYRAIHFISFKATYAPTIKSLPILGRPTKGHRATGGEGKFSGSAYFVDSWGTKIMDSYNKTGVLPQLTIQVTQEDKASRSGKQTVVFNGCLLDETTLINFDADSDDYMRQDVSGTFDDFTVPTTFNDLPGM